MRTISGTMDWRGIEIETQFGCIGQKLPAVEVLRDIMNGVWPRDFEESRLPPRLNELAAQD
jgi:hypothetical protein